MISGLLSKIISETILSIIPSFIKSININFFDKYFIRFLIFVIISSFFVDYNVIKKYLFHLDGLILGFITIIHVMCSYRGYELLKGGVANSIFYLYPIFILFLSNYQFKWVYLILIIGLILLALGNVQNELKNENFDTENYQNNDKNNSTQENNKNIFVKDQTIERYHYEGIINMLVASITEALIYFYVLKIKTDNSWNHLFISYFIGLLLISVYYYKKLVTFQINNKIIVTGLFYIFILLIGYYLRFYAINHLNIYYYVLLSYLGIILTYINGFIFLGEKINMYNIGGTGCIILGNFLLKFYNI